MMSTSEKKASLINEMRRFYQEMSVSPSLSEAILYSINGGGKRIRPLMLLELLEAFGVELSEGHFKVAAALEMIHTGSLIHDDLPAMDNDDYRRGQLTNHKQFDEATAILAGDGLFLDPYYLLATSGLDSEIIVALVAELSKASGSMGMVAGQMLDMLSENQKIDLERLKKIHRNKTGRLLTYPFIATAIVMKSDKETKKMLTEMGEWIGLAFQIRDDILDLTADFEELGKTPMKDIAASKATYPSLLGLEKSHQILEDCLAKSELLLEELKKRGLISSEKVLAIIERLRLHD